MADKTPKNEGQDIWPKVDQSKSSFELLSVGHNDPEASSEEPENPELSHAGLPASGASEIQRTSDMSEDWWNDPGFSGPVLNDADLAEAKLNDAGLPRAETHSREHPSSGCGDPDPDQEDPEFGGRRDPEPSSSQVGSTFSNYGYEGRELPSAEWKFPAFSNAACDVREGSSTERRVPDLSKGGRNGPEFISDWREGADYFRPPWEDAAGSRDAERNPGFSGRRHDIPIVFQSGGARANVTRNMAADSRLPPILTRGVPDSRPPPIITRGDTDSRRPQIHTRGVPAGRSARREVVMGIPDRSGRRVLIRGVPGPNGGLIITNVVPVSRSNEGPPILTRDLPVSDTEPIAARERRERSQAVQRPQVKAKGCSRLIVVAIITATVIASAITGIVIHGNSKSGHGPHTDHAFKNQAEKVEGAEFHASFDYDHRWYDQMSNPHSITFRSLASPLEKLIYEIYSFSPIHNRFSHSTVTRLSKHESRILVTMVLKLKDWVRTSGDSDLQAVDLKMSFLEGHRKLLNSYEVLLQHKHMAVKIITISLIVSSDKITTTTTTTTEPAWKTSRRTTSMPVWRPSTTPAVKLPDVPCGEVRVLPDVRIVGGGEAMKGVYPWMVMLVKDATTKKGAFYCGGSILDRWNVITAAHCLREESKDTWTDIVDTKTHRITVIAGKHESSTSMRYSQEQRVPARAAYMHTSFSMTPGLVNDIAVIRLSRPLQFNSRVTPICLPSAADPMPPLCVIAGWGSMDYENEDLPDTLRATTLRTYNSTECQRTFQSSFKYRGHPISYYLRDGIMCASNTTFGGQDTCQGDSGGPLFCLQSGASGEKHYTQFGVVSWGLGCGNPGEPGFYTHLPHYMSWLHNVALPALDRHSSSQQSDSICRTFSPLSDFRLNSCRNSIRRLTWNSPCWNISGVVTCVTEALERYSHYCKRQEVFNTIVNSPAVGLTSRQRHRCQDVKTNPSVAICHDLSAISSALKVCTQNISCVSMLEATLCVHSRLDPSWLHCSRQVLQDFISSRLNSSLRICEDYTVRTKADGRQFMYFGGDWYVLCGNHWGQSEVKVACKPRGYKNGKASYIHRTEKNVHASDLPIASGAHHLFKASGWMKVTCSGYESSLAECELERQTTCPLSYLAASVCYNTAYNFTLYATQSGADYGYISLTRDKGQGYVCVPDLSDPAAHQLCREAGYVGGMAYTFNQTMAPPPSSAVWETEMQCGAGAVDVNGCVGRNWTLWPRGSRSCSLATVFCFSDKARLHSGLFNSTGIVQIYQPAPSGHDVKLKTVCRQGINDVAAGILCRQMGFSGSSARSLPFNPFYKPNTEYITIDCRGHELRLEECMIRDAQMNVCTQPAVVQCLSRVQSEPDLSLQIGNADNEVLVSLDGRWGTVCTDHWTDNEAAIICRQLGHLYGYRHFPPFDADPRRNVPHVLHNLQCGVNATSLTQCSYNRVMSNVCQHKRAAAVLCSNQSTPVYSLHNPNSSQSNQGLVHMNYKGTTAPLRAYLYPSAARALCRALGFVTGERKYYPGMSTRGVFWMSRYPINCTDIYRCPLREPELINCTGHVGYHVSRDSRCYTVASVYCYPSAARVHTSTNQTLGEVQLYREGQWWDVCHDDITQSAADVICHDIMRSPTAAAVLLRNVYRLGSYQTVKASSFCDARDPTMTSSDCLVLDLTSKCESFNNDPASIVCYEGNKPSGAITGWKADSPSGGRVWVKRYGVWGTVCDDRWLDQEARLLCKHLGYSSGSYDRLPKKHDSTTPLWAWSVDCKIWSAHINSCQVNLTSVVKGRCRTDRDAGVSCHSYSWQDGLYG